jgi:hypothetical protein
MALFLNNTLANMMVDKDNQAAAALARAMGSKADLPRRQTKHEGGVWRVSHAEWRAQAEASASASGDDRPPHHRNLQMTIRREGDAALTDQQRISASSGGRPPHHRTKSPPEGAVGLAESAIQVRKFGPAGDRPRHREGKAPGSLRDKRSRRFRSGN